MTGQTDAPVGAQLPDTLTPSAIVTAPEKIAVAFEQPFDSRQTRCGRVASAAAQSIATWIVRNGVATTRGSELVSDALVPVPTQTQSVQLSSVRPSQSSS